MTREEKLYSMRMQELLMVAEKLGIKINKKGSKEKAIEKILAAEVNQEKNWDDGGEQIEKIKEEEKVKAAESDKQAEDIVNKKKSIPADDIPPKKKSSGRGALLEYKGELKNICAWAKELGISANTLYGRIYRMGWSIEKAFETPGRN